MQTTLQLAKHLKEIYFGGNWTCVNYKKELENITWQKAIHKTENTNSIATLVFHSTYYTSALIDVLEGKPLTAKDEISFVLPPINSELDWQTILNRIWIEAEKAIDLVEKLPEEKLFQDFTDSKYGSYFRNILGIIEHLHYCKLP